MLGHAQFAAWMVAGLSLVATQDRDAERRRMVDDQLKARDIRNERVLDAMRAVPRHLFVPESQRRDAYRDSPLPIGYGQTISQPYIVAFMTQALEIQPTDRVLEIGTGSGYQAAVLSVLAGQVFTIEIVPQLAERARQTLVQLGYRNVEVRAGNGYLGWPEHAPFDRIMVTAAPNTVPQELVKQLKVGGLMAIPVGTFSQELKILRRTDTGVETLQTLPVRFVPMVGEPKVPKVPGVPEVPKVRVPGVPGVPGVPKVPKVRVPGVPEVPEVPKVLGAPRALSAHHRQLLSALSSCRFLGLRFTL